MSYVGDHAIIHFITFMMTKTGKNLVEFGIVFGVYF